MFAYLVLLLAVLSRILPHAFHSDALNFTAIGGGLLFFGSRMSKDTGKWTAAVAAKLASALLVLMAADYYLTVRVYQYPFELRGYAVTWVWYAAVCLFGMGLLRKPGVLRVAGGALATSTSFFLISNFMVWAAGTMYPRTLAGLGACYTAGIPFYRNDLASTVITASAVFGLPVLAANIAESLHAQNDLPLA
jgi:hypothetical protein